MPQHISKNDFKEKCSLEGKLLCQKLKSVNGSVLVSQEAAKARNEELFASLLERSYILEHKPERFSECFKSEEKAKLGDKTKLYYITNLFEFDCEQKANELIEFLGLSKGVHDYYNELNHYYLSGSYYEISTFDDNSFWHIDSDLFLWPSSSEFTLAKKLKLANGQVAIVVMNVNAGNVPYFCISFKPKNIKVEMLKKVSIFDELIIAWATSLQVDEDYLYTKKVQRVTSFRNWLMAHATKDSFERNKELIFKSINL